MKHNFYATHASFSGGETMATEVNENDMIPYVFIREA